MAPEPDPANPAPANPAPDVDRPEDEPPGSVDLPVRDAILKACAGDRPIDPMAVARDLGGSPNDVVPWRALLRRIRAAAAALQDSGEIVVLRKGKPVDIRTAKGVIRLARPGARGA